MPPAVPGAPAERRGRFSGTRFLARWVLPACAIVLAAAAGYFKWVVGSAQESHAAAAESVRAATDSTIAILSYRSESVDQDLAVATGRLTGGFREEYKQLVGDVVVPGAKQQHITAVATVPAAASVSATRNHAEVLVFVDQTTTIGKDSPTKATSGVRVTLDKMAGRWLIRDSTRCEVVAGSPGLGDSADWYTRSGVSGTKPQCRPVRT